MKKPKIVTLLSLILVGIAFVLTLSACGDASGKTSDSKTADSKQTVESGKTGERINNLVEAWNAAGINAEVKAKSSSSTLNSMYGCINQYTVSFDDEQFMILEYDLKYLNKMAENYLQFINVNGYVSKSNDPVWRNQEFLLRNSYQVLESGDVVAEFSVEAHPKGEQIVDVFQSFK